MRLSALFVFVLGLSAPVGASAGTPIDPNLGDFVFGISDGVRYASESTSFDAMNGYGNTEVGCGGPEWHLLGGGSASGGPVTQAWQSAARPDDFNDVDMLGDDGWYTSGHGTAPAEFTGYSICIRDADIRYRMKTVTASVSSLRTGSVSCGGPAWHVTTGSAFIATSGSWVNSSFPMDDGDPKGTLDDGWTGSVYDSIGGAGGFYVHAVCARGLTLRYVKRPPIKVSAGGAVARKVACRPQEHAVGGGARVTGPANRSRLVSTFPYDAGDPDGIPDDGWQSRVYGISGADKKVTSFAICLG
jgi:hypothetical protein